MSTPINIIEYRIGRNIGTEPMEQDEWNIFVERTRAILDGIADGLNNPRRDLIAAGVSGIELHTQWTEVHYGAGTWTDEDGTVVREESAVVTLYTDADTFDLPLRDLLVELAGDLAWEFDQIAVALVWQGQSTLVPSRMEEAIAEEEELDAMLGIVVGALLGEDD